MADYDVICKGRTPLEATEKNPQKVCQFKSKRFKLVFYILSIGRCSFFGKLHIVFRTRASRLVFTECVPQFAVAFHAVRLTNSTQRIVSKHSIVIASLM
jgi:hypothetical protein